MPSDLPTVSVAALRSNFEPQPSVTTPQTTKRSNSAPVLVDVVEQGPAREKPPVKAKSPEVLAHVAASKRSNTAPTLGEKPPKPPVPPQHTKPVGYVSKAAPAPEAEVSTPVAEVTPVVTGWRAAATKVTGALQGAYATTTRRLGGVWASLVGAVTGAVARVKAALAKKPAAPVAPAATEETVPGSAAVSEAEAAVVTDTQEEAAQA
jgi:hypothetical protein